MHVGLKAIASNLSFSASLGAATVNVSGGSAALNANGNISSNTPAVFHVNIDDADLRLYFDELFASNFDILGAITTSIDAGVVATLPIQFGGIDVGPVHITISDLMAFFAGDVGSVTMSVPDFEQFLLNNGILAILKNPAILADARITS